MTLRDPKPEIQRLEELVTAIRHGEIRLPKFQRPFVWDRDDMLNLLDSIYNGYPIGSILLWHSSERLKSEKAIEGFDLDAAAIDRYPTDYLLDGQQRLTTLCGALFWEGNDQNSIWRIFFDLDKEEFTYAKDPVGVNLFPLNKLIRTSDFIRQCMKFEQSEKSREYYATAEKLLQSIKDYKIAVVKIGDIGLDEVAPIFERINSTGRKLTMVDLMRAATWKGGFDLTSEIDEIIAAVDRAGFGEISDTSILRSISASAGFGINKEDIDKLRTCSVSELRSASSEVKKSLLQALEFLRIEVSLDDLSFLPYGVQLTHLTEFFRVKPNPDNAQKRLLTRWFWTTSIARHFAGASTGQNAKDLEMIRGYARGDREFLEMPKWIDISPFLFDQFNLRNASSTGFALLLKTLNPQSNIYGTPFDRAHIKEKDRHIFEDLIPRGALNNSGRNIGQMLNPFKDAGHVSLTNENLSSATLTAHLLDEICIDAILKGDYAQLIRSRAHLITERLHQMTGIELAATAIA